MSSQTTDRQSPYELHLTVRTDLIKQFEETCKTLGVKPIILDLQRKDGSLAIKDVMTSSRFYGTYINAGAEGSRISRGLTDAGLEVIRTKIETAPWHYEAPQAQYDARGTGKYFETHLSFEIEKKDLPALRGLCESLPVHISRNPFKEEGDVITQMVTYREDTYRKKFDENAETILYTLAAEGFVSRSFITEYVIFDSNVHHDSAWVNS